MRTRVRLAAVTAGLLVMSAISLAGCSSGSTSSTSSHVTTTTKFKPPVLLNDPEQLNTTAFLNPNDGYGLFRVTNQKTGTCQDLVGHTTDGGKTFSKPVAVPGNLSCSNYPGSGLTFDDHGDGFLYGPGLSVTHNSGRTWLTITYATLGSPSPPTQIVSVEAMGQSVWMLLAGCASVTTGSCSVALQMSSDGGRTWTPSPSLPPGISFPNQNVAGVNTGQTWMVRTGPSSAYLMLSPVKQTPGVNNSAPLFFTSDSGKTWSDRSVPCGIYAFNAVLTAAPDGTLLAVCAGQPSAGYQGKSVLQSTNGGVTWPKQFLCQPTPASSTQCFNEPQNHGYLTGIEAVTADHAYLFGPRGPLLVTSDGGNTWKPDPSGIGDAGEVNQVVFLNASKGIAVAPIQTSRWWTTALWSTSDGGAHWTSHIPQIR